LGLHKTLFIFISLFMLNLVLFTFYKEQQDLPEQRLESVQANQLIQDIRSANFIASYTQKANNFYINASHMKSELSYQESIDALQAAKRHLDILSQHYPNETNIINLELLKQIEQVNIHTLNKSKEYLEAYRHSMQILSKEIKQFETSLWNRYQTNYRNFLAQSNEVQQFYSYTLLFMFIFLLFVVLLYWQQRRLNGIIKNNEMELEELAYFDILTRIPNRQSIEAELDQQIAKCRRKQKSFYIAQIDLDDFKKINDSLGHAIGDALLIEVANILYQSIRKEDMVGRIGGDEFIIIFNEDMKDEDLHVIFERIFKSFEKAIVIDNQTIYSSLSLGIAKYPDDAKSEVELFKCADIAMYESKRNGRNQFQFYNQKLGQRLKETFKLENEIKNALQNGEFVLYYQPKFDIRTSKIVGLEALTRWQHPTKGLIAPNEFIPLIEKGCCVKDFGEWVIREAAMQQDIWRQNAKSIVDISVNLAIKHIHTPNFVDDIKALIHDYAIDLNHFSFEITEYSLMDNQSKAIHDLTLLEQVGVRFALDDFGTGYSSLTYLDQLPVDTIKIDKSFIDAISVNNSQNLLVDAIITIAKALKLKMVAEGVEDDYQVEYLRSRGCYVVQGYFYCKPISAKEVEYYL
jgi:diguanylate cyclase (GGDEF)-like protein